MIVLASTSPQRPRILEQLGIPFELAEPAYEEAPDGDPVEHAAGKARSVAANGCVVLGVDTVVRLGERTLGKPADEADAREMLAALAGQTHTVVSGLCLRNDSWEDLRTETTAVTFRQLAPAEIEAYVATGEWEGRAGGYAIQGRGATLVERIDGDYLNVVGLPAAALVAVLATRFPGVYGLGEPTV